VDVSRSIAAGAHGIQVARTGCVTTSLRAALLELLSCWTTTGKLYPPGQLPAELGFCLIVTPEPTGSRVWYLCRMTLLAGSFMPSARQMLRGAIIVIDPKLGRFVDSDRDVMYWQHAMARALSVSGLCWSGHVRSSARLNLILENIILEAGKPSCEREGLAALWGAVLLGRFGVGGSRIACGLRQSSGGACQVELLAKSSCLWFVAVVSVD